MGTRLLISSISEKLNDLDRLAEINDAFQEYATRWLLTSHNKTYLKRMP
ncbi:hypothetical protein [Vulcanisaeta moutnovskia]|nr:hypothetical protein [Vulcanisaeta moutnovskia]